MKRLPIILAIVFTFASTSLFADTKSQNDPLMSITSHKGKFNGQNVSYVVHFCL